MGVMGGMGRAEFALRQTLQPSCKKYRLPLQRHYKKQ